MKERITITIDAELIPKIRKLQSELISATDSSWSASSIISVLIEEGLKTFNPKSRGIKTKWLGS